MLISSLEGDGVNLSFFQFLWNKATDYQEKKIKEKNYRSSNSTRQQRENTIVLGQEKSEYLIKAREDDCDVIIQKCAESLEMNDQESNMRIPDSVVFQHGQPYNWYFTSNKGKTEATNRTRYKSRVLRKRRRNLNMENIERDFIRKCTIDNGGRLDFKRDIIAYFIASTDCTSRRHQNQLDQSSLETVGNSKNEIDGEEHVQCDIEYLNAEDLHEFLFHKRLSQSGLLQRFLKPAGGSHNSQIRVLWTPSLGIVERRKSNYSLNDTRYGLYERAVTFDGPDIYSTSMPVRGTILARQLKTTCDAIAHRLAISSKSAMPLISSNHSTNATLKGMGGQRVARMVLHFKIDFRDRIWLLYSSSIRLADFGTSKNDRLTISSYPWKHQFVRNDRCTTSPMNISNIVKLPPTIQLNQNANHNRSFITRSKEVSLIPCVSCAQRESSLNFQSVSYNTIVSHFEHAMVMLKSSPNYVNEWQWPPKNEFIKAAGDVGFGPLLNTMSSNGGLKKQLGNRQVRSMNHVEILEDDLVIPPIIRQLHPRLRVDGYQRYRGDHHFLHKTCLVCERCFLSYANLITNSFQMIRPIQHL